MTSARNSRENSIASSDAGRLAGIISDIGRETPGSKGLNATARFSGR